MNHPWRALWPKTKVLVTRPQHKALSAMIIRISLYSPQTLQPQNLPRRSGPADGEVAEPGMLKLLSLHWKPRPDYQQSESLN